MAQKRRAETVEQSTDGAAAASNDNDGISTTTTPTQDELYQQQRQENAKRQKVYQTARKDLGEAFGTKKAQKLQRSRDSNRVDTSGLNTVLDSLVSEINTNAANGPSRAAIQEKQESMRPIPPHDVTAESPELAYPIGGIMLKQEVDAIRPHCSQLKKSASGSGSDDKAKLQMLATGSSRYLASKLRQACSQEKVDGKRIRIIYYASVLAGLFIHRRGISDRDRLLEKLRSPPTALVESLLARFVPNGKTMDSRDEHRLLTHLFALALHLDGFATEPRQLQEDLGLRPPVVATLFKEMGCQMQPLTETQRVQRGLSKIEARQVKRAVLKVPLIFPEIKRGGPPKK